MRTDFVVATVGVVVLVLSILAVVKPYRVKFKAALWKLDVSLEAEGSRRPRQPAPPRQVEPGFTEHRRALP